MNSSGLDYTDEIVIKRRKAPGSIDRNRNKSSRVKIAAPEPMRAQIGPTSAPVTPLKCNRSQSMRYASQEQVDRNGLTSAAPKRNLSMSPTLKKKQVSHASLYDEPADLAVPSTSNLPPVRSNSAVDRMKSTGRISPVRRVSPVERRVTPPIEEFPPLPDDIVDGNIVSPDDLFPVRKDEPSEFPPMPDAFSIIVES